MEKNSITYLFEDVSLYEKKEFLIYDGNDDYYNINIDQLSELYNYIGLIGNDNLITLCEDCNNRFPFTMECEVANFNSFVEKDFLLLGKNFQNNEKIKIYFNAKSISKSYINNFKTCKIIKDELIDNNIFLYYRFTCTNDHSHVYNMLISIKNQNQRIIVKKIGQYPDKTIIGEFECDKYKNVLTKFDNCFIDYRNSEKSYKNGLYVGAYAYLRRVFETILNYYLKKENLTEEQRKYSKSKIKAVKKYYDESIQDVLYNEYDILSKGIHNLSEDVCKENYGELKCIINVQLQKVKSDIERKKQLDASKSKLENFRKKLKNNEK